MGRNTRRIQVHNQPQLNGFSGFAWATALFCLPAILWPLALLVSPSVADNPALSSRAVYWFSTALWIYPLGLFATALLLAKLRRTAPQAAWLLLFAAFIAFYGFLAYLIIRVWH
ncbi:hypothetical protein FHQ28_03265 [Pasteurellaceae bacterium USgator11]|nr:hypothetical protein FHQ19_03205 [Pasteurellaceae bacterium UScroc12]TNG98405.1 hypothetical protein FHQ20_00650 [Pasteurellaceae bacterium USgator41]TNH01107.1 hypothetical protein FHQ24_01845 [Pasteurellaceae bacterium UScroc31]TNH02437.1 hypothetical protein FHQ28_03265 [Pasteurellaceae bacterium USgator11]